jgi:hypothetical protein
MRAHTHIYIQLNNYHWTIGNLLCNVWCVIDVSASTASIINLVLISLDRCTRVCVQANACRLFAVVRHTEYQTEVHRRRVYVAIMFCWLFSLIVGLPLGAHVCLSACAHTPRTGTGMNQPVDAVDDEYFCGVANASYMLYGSICAFYIPCAVIVATYG